MDMLAAMRIFQKVAATLSFTDAGDLLGLAPSSVSRQIDLLEAHLGVRLLTRSTRKLALTEAGESYSERLDDLLADVDAVHTSIAAYGSEPQGRLRISSPRVFGRRVLAPLLPGFLRAYPRIQVELSLTDDYVHLIETDTDLAVRIGALQDSGLISRSLGRYRRVLCCHPSYLERRAAPQTPGDLAQHNCLRYRRAGERVVWQFSGQDGSSSVEPRGDLIANDIEVLYDATLSGLGIGLLPLWLVRDNIERGELVQLLSACQPKSNQQGAGIHFVYTLNRRQSRKIHVFMDHVMMHMGKLMEAGAC